MKVWRVQNSQGRGPYWGVDYEEGITWQTKMHNLQNGCPPPEDDPVLRLRWYEADQSFIFGFATEQQLRSWFWPDELEKLAELGYEIVCLEAEVVLEGEYQVAFKPKRPVREMHVQEDIPF